MGERIPSGCPAIDDLLGGGFERDCITEIYGEAGSGKTNICLQTAIREIKNGNYVVYVDTEGISMERFEQLGGTEELARKLIIYRVFRFAEQADVIERITKLVTKKNVSLIIIDSLTEYYRAEMGIGEDYSNHRSLAWQLAMLSNIARQKNIAVIVTNQVYMDSQAGEVRPIGGHALHHAAKCIIKLKKLGVGVREAELVKHRSIQEGSGVRFYITRNGIIGD